MAQSSNPRRRLARAPYQLAHDGLDWAMDRLAFFPPLLHIVALSISGIVLSLSQKPDGTYDPVYVSWGVGLTALAVGLNLLIEKWRRSTAKAQQHVGGQFMMTLSHAFQPIIDELARMNVTPTNQREKRFQKIVGLVAHAVVKFILAEDRQHRVVVYSVAHKQGQKRRLVVETYSGRKDEPRTIADGDGGRGQRIFQWLDQAVDADFVADLGQTPPPSGEPIPRAYSTYIATPIKSNGKTYGLLAVDAPSPGDLDESDLPAISVLASLLSAAYTSARK